MDIRAVLTTCGCACALGAAWSWPVHATGPDAVAGPPTAGLHEETARPWLQPVDAHYPIRRMSALKTEYRRIRELRRTQIQPEYERRMASSGEAAADAWRDEVLREVAKRDLRDLRARLER